MHGSQSDGCDIFAIPTDWTQNIEILRQTDEWYENEIKKLDEMSKKRVEEVVKK